jgi:hypothetical protein
MLLMVLMMQLDKAPVRVELEEVDQFRVGCFHVGGVDEAQLPERVARPARARRAST